MKKILLYVGLLLLLTNPVNAGLAGLGEACNSPCDCQEPYACRGGVCTVDCYSHGECDLLGSSCNTRFTGFGSFCGAGNTCVPALGLGQSCDDTVVCPECECSMSVCELLEDFFIDELDDDHFYCSDSAWIECHHVGSGYYAPNAYYLADLQNVYYCIGTPTDGWDGPVCPAGYEWGIVNYPQEVINEMQNISEGCIPRQTPVSEYPLPVIPLIAVFGVLGAVIALTRNR